MEDEVTKTLAESEWKIITVRSENYKTLSMVEREGLMRDKAGEINWVT
jgi:hypothetical protein